MKRMFAAVVLSALAMTGCTTAKYLRITDAPIGSDVPDDQIAAKIERALSNKGWQVGARRPGAIDAFVVIREHRAEVTITYDNDSYSIEYLGSQNLDATQRTIHRNYNRWVANLNTEIQGVMAGAR
ncbi:MAG: hypothetical protein WDM79_04640 [Terricaulis sp.]